MTILRCLLVFLFILIADNYSVAMEESVAMEVDPDAGSCARTRQYETHKRDHLSAYDDTCKALSVPCNRVEVIWGYVNLCGRLPKALSVERDTYNDQFSENSSGNVFYRHLIFYRTIPPELWNSILSLSWLKKLDLSGNNLRRFPSGIEKLQRLEELDLSGNNLEQVPNGIMELKNLRVLDLSNNNLRAIPAEIENLENLTTLSVSYNLISCLPASLTKLSELRNFYANDNELCNITVILDLLNLTSLDLSNNHIKNVPIKIGLLKSLKKLHLYNNPFTKVPITLGNLESIKEIMLPVLSEMRPTKYHWGIMQVRKRFHNNVWFVFESDMLTPENFFH